MRTDFDDGNRAALHPEILQRLDAPLLAFSELLFGEKDIRWIVRGIRNRRIIILHGITISMLLMLSLYVFGFRGLGRPR